MAYFQQIDELLKPKGSNLYGGQQPAEGGQASATVTAPQQSTAISNQKPTLGGSSASSGASFNAAAQGKTPEQYTKVGYNPKAYQKASGNQSVNLQEDVVKGANQAQQQLKQQSEAFAQSQPKVQNVTDQQISSGLAGNADDFQAISNILNPTPLTPEQKQPNFSNIAAPEINTSKDSLAAKLQKAAAGNNYTKGMSNFDAALYKRSDKYKQDLGDAQKAINDYNANLNAEIEKWKGTDREAELIAAKNAMRERLSGMGADINQQISGRLSNEQNALNLAPAKAMSKIDEKAGKIVGKKEKQLRDRLAYLEAIGGPMGGVDMGSSGGRIKEYRDEIASLKNQLKKLKKGGGKLAEKYTSPGSVPQLAASDVTSQDEATRFNAISRLLGEGGSIASTQGLQKASAVDAKLKGKDLRDYLDRKYQIGAGQYGAPVSQAEYSRSQKGKSKGDKKSDKKKKFDKAASQMPSFPR